MHDRVKFEYVIRLPVMPGTDDALSEAASKGATQPESDSRIKVRIDDLAFVGGEAIAWPVNEHLAPTTPLLRRLEIAGGAALASKLRVEEPFPVGSAVVSDAGDLPADLLVSAVIVSENEQVTPSSVRRALTSALQRATDWQIDSLVCAPFGLGAGNLDVDESAEIMVDVLARHLSRASFPALVTIVVESELERDAFAAALSNLNR